MKIHRIWTLIFLPFLALWANGITPMYAQSFWSDLTISVDFAAAHHDKRTPSRNIKQPSIFDIPSDTEERWSPWQFGISVQKPVLDWKNIRMEAGLGYSLEYQNYYRMVNGCFHLPEGTPCPRVVVYSDNYKIHLAQVPVTATFPVAGNLKAELSILPLFDIYKKAWRPSGKLIGEKTTIDFYAFEINPGLRYQGNHIALSMNYRLYQVKKIDPVIFNPSNEKLEDYNPLKFWFSVGYRLGAGKEGI